MTQQDKQEQDGEKTLEMPCNNMVYLLMTQHKKEQDGEMTLKIPGNNMV
jgi:hypothetical protein